MSMAVGEYVSVSTQRDAEMALLAKERRELREELGVELRIGELLAGPDDGAWPLEAGWRMRVW